MFGKYFEWLKSWKIKDLERKRKKGRKNNITSLKINEQQQQLIWRKKCSEKIRRF